MVEGKRTAAGVCAHAQAQAAAIAGAALLSFVLAAAESVCAETAQQPTKDDAADTIDLVRAGRLVRPDPPAPRRQHRIWRLVRFSLVRAPDLPPNTCPAHHAIGASACGRRRHRDDACRQALRQRRRHQCQATGQRDRRGRAELRHSAELLECRFRHQLELLRLPRAGSSHSQRRQSVRGRGRSR
jgi:hypothetical protein